MASDDNLPKAAPLAESDKPIFSIYCSPIRLDSFPDVSSSKQDAIFWQVMHLNIIPDNGWMNRNHLNSTGASIYSQWLGEQIANAVQSGDLGPIESENDYFIIQVIQNQRLNSDSK